MLTYIHTFKTNGIEAVPVTVETEISNGIGIHLVGLADEAVKESLLRTVTALQSLGCRIPGKRIVINLAPAELVKRGCGFDLPIALGIISASEQESLPDREKYIIAGELGLDGSLRDIPGWMQAAELAKESGKACILPTESAKLAARALGDAVKIYGADDLHEVIDILNDGAPDWTAQDECDNLQTKDEEVVHFWDDIRGNATAKRALEIAAAGNLPILLMGVPGSGKMALAQALREILPPMSEEESKEVQRIYSSASKRIAPGLRPFRAPHPSASIAAMFGGTGGCLPGEVSFAHNGVLCIDQCAEMPKAAWEYLRVPLEDKKVVLSRLKRTVTYPANPLLVLTTNPCPCGYYGDGDRCTCTVGQRTAYLNHLQGPVMDHVMLHVWTQPESDSSVVAGDTAKVVAARVHKAREIQMKRQGKLNNELSATEIANAVCTNTEDGRSIAEFTENMMMKLGLSTRSYTRILKIARTIADLEGYPIVLPSHLGEAASFRFLDRSLQ